MFLETIVEDTLKWDLNTEAITKKGHQRLHLLRKVRSFNVDPILLKLFYKSFVENVLTFSFICWFYNLNTKQRKSLQRTVNINSKIMCDQVTTVFFYFIFLTECICILCLFVALSMFFRVGTSFSLLRIRIIFLITPLLSAWQSGPNIRFGWRRRGGGGRTEALHSIGSLWREYDFLSHHPPHPLPPVLFQI